MNNAPFPPRLLHRYAADGQYPVPLDEAESLTMAERIIQRPLLDTGVFIRHSPAALAAAIMEIIAAPRGNPWNAPDAPSVFDCDDFLASPVLGVRYGVQSLLPDDGTSGHPDATLTVRGADADGG